MMRKIILVLCMLVSLAMTSLFPSGNAAAVMDPRAKVIIQVATYGTVSGALLGTASMAFGASGKRIAQGASLGLYTGLIFGSYVVFAHRSANDDDYPTNAPAIYREDGPTSFQDHQKERGIESDSIVAFVPFMNYRF